MNSETFYGRHTAQRQLLCFLKFNYSQIHLLYYYRQIKSQNDHTLVQNDLNELKKWAAE